MYCSNVSWQSCLNPRNLHFEIRVTRVSRRENHKSRIKKRETRNFRICKLERILRKLFILQRKNNSHSHASLSHIKWFTQAGEGSRDRRRGWGLNLMYGTSHNFLPSPTPSFLVTGISRVPAFLFPPHPHTHCSWEVSGHGSKPLLCLQWQIQEEGLGVPDPLPPISPSYFFTTCLTLKFLHQQDRISLFN